MSALRPAPTTRATNSEVANTVLSRSSTLIVLLLIQSVSQIVLQRNELLIRRHVIIPMFLTMLVGAGGNAGNQSAVRVITGLATHQFTSKHVWRILLKEFVIGLCCAFILAVIAVFRVRMFFVTSSTFGGGGDVLRGDPTTEPSGLEDKDVVSIVVIALSLFTIVLSSVILGAMLPFVFQRVGLKVEHAAPAIQVLMDIFGVWTTCMVASLIIG